MLRVVHVVDHPLVQHKLTIMRSKETDCAKFRQLLKEISLLLCYEVTRDVQLEEVEIETPLTKTKAKLLEGKKLVFVPILRAGTGILEGMLELVPAARVGHIGLYRDPKTLQTVEYYFNLPHDVSDRDVIVVDPMLATGNSAIAAISRIKQKSPKSLKFVNLIACPEGIQNFHAVHPDVPIYTAAIDERLNEHGYILPGLGDAGDRIFGTK